MERQGKRITEGDFLLSRHVVDKVGWGPCYWCPRRRLGNAKFEVHVQEELSRKHLDI